MRRGGRGKEEAEWMNGWMEWGGRSLVWKTDKVSSGWRKGEAFWRP